MDRIQGVEFNSDLCTVWVASELYTFQIGGGTALWLDAPTFERARTRFNSNRLGLHAIKLLEPRKKGFTATLVDDCMFLLGGDGQHMHYNTSEKERLAFKFDTVLQEFTTFEGPLTTGHSAVESKVNPSTLILFGGKIKDTNGTWISCNELRLFDVYEQRESYGLRCVGTPPVDRTEHACYGEGSSEEDVLYVYGGYNGRGEPLFDLHHIKLSAFCKPTWTQVKIWPRAKIMPHVIRSQEYKVLLSSMSSRYFVVFGGSTLLVFEPGHSRGIYEDLMEFNDRYGLEKYGVGERRIPLAVVDDNQFISMTESGRILINKISTE